MKLIWWKKKSYCHGLALRLPPDKLSQLAICCNMRYCVISSHTVNNDMDCKIFMHVNYYRFIAIDYSKVLNLHHTHLEVILTYLIYIYFILPRQAVITKHFQDCKKVTLRPFVFHMKNAQNTKHSETPEWEWCLFTHMIWTLLQRGSFCMIV